MPIVDAVKACFRKYGDFEGRATRAEYWWFFLAVLLASATASVISIRLYSLVTLVTFLPLIAVGARRLHDVNRAGWWQLVALVPFGVVVVIILLAQARKAEQPHFWDRPAGPAARSPAEN
jgi:uncharacterized membrane protein YhaH (DUF805 family)